MKPVPVGDGLNSSNYDETTQEEIDTFREFYRLTKGYSIPALEFWLEFRPDVLKRYRANFVRETTSVEERKKPLPHVLAMLHYYAIVGYSEGILYEIKLAQSGGATKVEIIDTLAVAFIHGNPLGGNFVATSSTEYLHNWQEPQFQDRWPAAWSFDPNVFKSGLDFSTTDASKMEMDRLLTWYRDKLGEVPPYVRFLARERPTFLKAYRNRFEHAIRDGLPKQMMPYLLLNLSVTRGFRDGIREAVLMSKWLGLTRAQVVDSICWGYYGGLEAINIAEEAAGDLISGLN